MSIETNEPQPVYPTTQTPPETEAAATTALILEIIFGFFSLLGIGHVYSGRTLLGILLMIAWWVYIVVASFLSVITLGFGACIFVPIYIAVPIISGIQARAHTLKTGAKGHGGATALVVGGGCLLAIILIVILVALGVFAGLMATYRSR